MLYALVAADCEFAIDVFVERAHAERALADAVADEPGFATLLGVVPVPLAESRAPACIRAQAASS